MQVVSLESVRRLASKREKAGIREFSFKNTYELVDFVAQEIRSANIKFSRLADKAGCCPRTVAKIAYRDTKEPRASTVLNILKALGFEIFVRG